MTVASQAPLCPWDFPGKNTRVGCHFLLQGIFPIQGLNPSPLHWQMDSLLLSHQGSPKRSVNGQQILDEPLSGKKGGRGRSGAQLSTGSPLPYPASLLPGPLSSFLLSLRREMRAHHCPLGLALRFVHPDLSFYPPTEFKAAGSCSLQAWMPVLSLPLQL